MGQVDSIRQTGVAGPGRGRGQPMQPPVAAGESLVYCLSRASVEKVRSTAWRPPGHAAMPMGGELINGLRLAARPVRRC